MPIGNLLSWDGKKNEIYRTAHKLNTDEATKIGSISGVSTNVRVGVLKNLEAKSRSLRPCGSLPSYDDYPAEHKSYDTIDRRLRMSLTRSALWGARQPASIRPSFTQSSYSGSAI